MALPIRTVLEDVDAICGYLVKKPTGATVAEARKVLDAKHLDGRKLSALKTWGLVEDNGGRLKVTAQGRIAVRDSVGRQSVLLQTIRNIEPYAAVIERAAHRSEESIGATDVAAPWHEHFPVDAADTDKILNDQAVCFFQVAAGAGLGQVTIGRRGMPTRFQFDSSALKQYLDEVGEIVDHESYKGTRQDPKSMSDVGAAPKLQGPSPETGVKRELGQAIFVAHGKNKRPLEQLKKILEQFKIPYRIATDEPNLGRPIGGKVKEVMESCNCAILIFTADEEFKDAKGSEIWRPSENVVFELGAAAGYLYGNRIVIMKEDGVEFPANFRDLGYISFLKDQLEAKAMEILKELIGFGIVKVST